VGLAQGCIEESTKKVAGHQSLDGDGDGMSSDALFSAINCIIYVIGNKLTMETM
jgi:hypothetical protein